MASWTARASARSVGLETPVSAPIRTSLTDRPGAARGDLADRLQERGNALAGVEEPEVPDHERLVVRAEESADVCARRLRRGLPVDVAADRHDPAAHAGAGLLEVGEVGEDGGVTGAGQESVGGQPRRPRLREQVRYQEIVERRDDAGSGERRSEQRRQQVDRAAEIERPGLKLDVEQGARPERSSARTTSGKTRMSQPATRPWTGTSLSPSDRLTGRSGRRQVRMPIGTPSAARASLSRAV